MQSMGAETGGVNMDDDFTPKKTEATLIAN